MDQAGLERDRRCTPAMPASRKPRASAPKSGAAETPRSNRPFVEELPELLATRGLSLRAFARDIGVNSSHLSRVLRGVDYRSAGPNLARSAANALGLPDDYFPEAREAPVVARIKSDPKLRDELYDAWQAEGLL